MQVNIQEAKTQLSKLVAAAEAGEEVVIARAGKPAVRLVPCTPERPPRARQLEDLDGRGLRRAPGRRPSRLRRRASLNLLLLVAQTRRHELTLVTREVRLGAYGVATLLA